MKPDMDDYADIDEVRPNGSRAMSWMVLAVAVGGFAALAYYAYHSGTKSQMDSEAMTVEADNTPIKEAPANPEGEQFPDKDKTIYDVISPNSDKTSEKLMPEPEHPVAAANVEDSEDDAPTAAGAPAAAAGTSTFVAKGTDSMGNTTSSTPQNVSEQPVATTAKPVTTPAPEPKVAPAPAAPKSYANPQMVNEKPSAKKEPVAAAKPAAKPASKPAATASKGGSYQVQLGAFKSEAEAQAAWKKLSGAHSDVLSGSPTIVQAQVNGTTYYRLRTGSFASGADAKATCAKLGGAACMPVK